MAERDYDSEIADLERELESVKRLKSEHENLTTEQKLAVHMINKLGNFAEQEQYAYEFRPDLTHDWTGSVHGKYLTRATLLMNKIYNISAGRTLTGQELQDVLKNIVEIIRK